MQQKMPKKDGGTNGGGGRIIFDNGASNAKGVAILFDRNLDIKINKVIKSGYGRYLIIESEINGQTILLTNVYAPNEDD